MNASPSPLPASPGGAYPVAPGFKERGGTSEAAATKVASRAQILRVRVLEALGRAGNMTADEVADMLGESVLSTRPRFSELAADGAILKTDARRPNASGHNAIVWKLAPHLTGGRA